MAVGLLQKILFHEDGVQSLGNYALDLFDHVIFSITNLAFGYCLVNDNFFHINYQNDYNNFRDEKYVFRLGSNHPDTQAVDEIIQHKHKIQFEVGIGYIGIMFNMLLHAKRYYYCS